MAPVAAPHLEPGEAAAPIEAAAAGPAAEPNEATEPSEAAEPQQAAEPAEAAEPNEAAAAGAAAAAIAAGTSASCESREQSMGAGWPAPAVAAGPAAAGSAASLRASAAGTTPRLQSGKPSGGGSGGVFVLGTTQWSAGGSASKQQFSGVDEGASDGRELASGGAAGGAGLRWAQDGAAGGAGDGGAGPGAELHPAGSSGGAAKLVGAEPDAGVGGADLAGASHAGEAGKPLPSASPPASAGVAEVPLPCAQPAEAAALPAFEAHFSAPSALGRLQLGSGGLLLLDPNPDSEVAASSVPLERLTAIELAAPAACPAGPGLIPIPDGHPAAEADDPLAVLFPTTGSGLGLGSNDRASSWGSFGGAASPAAGGSGPPVDAWQAGLGSDLHSVSCEERAGGWAAAGQAVGARQAGLDFGSDNGGEGAAGQAVEPNTNVGGSGRWGVGEVLTGTLESPAAASKEWQARGSRASSNGGPGYLEASAAALKLFGQVAPATGHALSQLAHGANGVHSANGRGHTGVRSVEMEGFSVPDLTFMLADTLEDHGLGGHAQV